MPDHGLVCDLLWSDPDEVSERVIKSCEMKLKEPKLCYRIGTCILIEKINSAFCWIFFFVFMKLTIFQRIHFGTELNKHFYLSSKCFLSSVLIIS